MATADKACKFAIMRLLNCEARLKAAPFSRWLPLPGVYVIACSRERLTDKPFALRPDIIYIGMTNSVGGLRSRLKQFDNTIAGRTGHGGADRVRYKFRNYEPLAMRLYVAVGAFNCDVTSASPANLRIMGDVARWEYYCLADFAEHFNRLPTFNDKKSAPKFSHTVGRSMRTRSRVSSPRKR